MATGLDVLLGGSDPTGLDVLMGTPAPAQKSVAPVVTNTKPLSWSDRIMKGLNDVSAAGAQIMTHALPEGAVNAVNSATKYVNDLPVIGPATQMLGMVPATAQSLDQDIKSGETEYQQRRTTDAQKLGDLITGKKADPGIDWLRMGGNMIGTAPIAAVAAPAGLMGAAGSGALFGAISQPVTDGDFATEKGKQVALGAVTGGAGYGAAKGLANLLAPKISPEVRTLLDAGVTPTIGQTLGGAMNRIEQGATSIPVVGDMIRNAQRRTIDQFNTAAVNRALTPIDGALPKGVAGRDAIEYAANKLGTAYDNVVNKIGSVKPDEKFLSDLANLQGLTANLPKGSTEQFGRIVDSEIMSRFTNGQITGEGLKAAESNLGQLAKGYGRSADFDQRQLGTAIQEAQNTLREMLARVKPDVAPELQAINSGYANLMRVQRAAAGVGAEGGSFTPAQLQSAVKALDPSKNNRQFATGNALMQDLSEAGKTVMGSKVPDSGTPYRHGVQAGLAMLLGHSFLPEQASALAIPAAGVAGMAALPYTTQGQKLASMLLTRRPEGAEATAEFLRSLAPYAGAAAVPAATR